MTIKEKYSTGYTHGLTYKDFIIRKNGKIVIHRISNKNDLSIGSIHRSNGCGLFKIIEKLKTNTTYQPYKIEFIKTGYQTYTRSSAIKSGMVYDKHIWKVFIGKVYESNSYGEFKIIECIDTKKLRFKVQFLNTGFMTDASIPKITIGRVQDDSATKNANVGEVYSSTNFGDFIIIDDLGRSKNHHDRVYKIKFISTGYETKANLQNIRNGDVKDLLLPNVYGIGYLGIDYEKLRDNDFDLHDTLYNRWSNMIARCYDKNNLNYPIYGRLGIKVDGRWHSFSNYCKDVQKINGFNRNLIVNGKLQLDKDKLQKGIPKNKMIYSKDTCIRLTIKDNNPRNVYK